MVTKLTFKTSNPILMLARWILRDYIRQLEITLGMAEGAKLYYKREADKANERYEKMAVAYYPGAKRLLQEREDARVGYTGSDI